MTISRYEKLNLKIESLRLHGDNSKCSVLYEELISKALSMGATILDIRGDFVLPNEVFEAENLVRLSVEKCRINLNQDRPQQYSAKSVRFDVSSLDKFTYEGPLIHHISFAPTSKFRVSRLAIKENRGLSTAWFKKLEIFLKELGRSEIHLSLRLGSKAIFDYEADEFQGVMKPEVDSLTVNMDGMSSITCYVLFDGLFRICRPKIIAHYILPESSCGGKGNTNNDFLGKRFLEGVKGKFSVGSHLMSSVNDLKEVNVQLFDDDVGAWTPLPWDSSLDASTSTCRKRKTLDEEFELPEYIIPRIQSFLTGKEATRTSILSNAWHHATITRPNLDFDVHDFRSDREDEPNSSSYHKFSKFVKKTISRYEQLKLKIETLRFREYTKWGDTDDDVCVVYKELIPKALSMGATLLDIGGDFLLPNEVFEAENLVRLSVEKCRINLDWDRPVRCPRLKSLCLSDVYIVEPNQICRIISGCPSIKKLSFTDAFGYNRSVRDGRLTNSHMQLTCLVCDVPFSNFVTAGDLSSKFPFLKDLTLHDICFFPRKEIVISSRSLERLNFICPERHYSDEKKIRFDVPSLRKFTYEGSLVHHISFAPTSKFWVVSRLAIMENRGLSTAWFGKLENLVKELGRSEIHICLRLGTKTIFDYEADEFQGVTKLVEVDNFTVDLDGLSSLTCCVLFDGLFDVPSLRKFTYEGSLVHHISFAPTSKFWVVSRLAITENRGLSTAWFGKLENLVKELGRSEIHICLRLGTKTIFDYEADEFQGVTKSVEVDTFTVDLDGLSSLTCCVLFDGLFRICRPKFVTHYLLPESSCGGKTNNDFLGKRLVEGVKGQFSIGSHLMSSVNDLKEVNVQLFDDDAGVWTPLPWDSFLDASRRTYRKREIRFQLAWKSLDN
ncbi:Unknown protein [Striga hermonthica]|uniref:F-box/LRR-repeat protein 15/At3g58940/PEG3-like LRR domain-containing protein n=1 Tax=Striga hermonthica TaxID=68872 RepID=A0A9N7RB87_STRHE|nr:Unknown protein [Striga hermonthica]